MKLEEMSQTELESMNYDDIAYMILKEENKKMKINDLFKRICEILNLGQDVFESQIADFFEIMTTDKRFTMLEDGYWDLRINHSQQIVLDDEFEEDEEEIEEELEEEFEEEFEDELLFLGTEFEIAEPSIFAFIPGRVISFMAVPVMLGAGLVFEAITVVDGTGTSSTV